jgi:copper(I)-binding protein
MNIATVAIVAVLLCSGVAGTAAAAPAADKRTAIPSSARIDITDAHAHATVPAQPVGAVYMTIASDSPLTLVQATTDVAKDVQIHDMHKHAGVMRMREIKRPQLKSGEKLVLAPGGMHMMLLGLTRQLKAGETISMTLRFEDKDKKQIAKNLNVPVQPLGKK